MDGPYYQTTALSDQQLADAFKKAESQNAKVMEIFRSRGAGAMLSPSQVHAIGRALGVGWLPTSVRRSMSDLAKAKALRKCDVLRAGPHGKPEHFWIISEGNDA